MTIESLQQNLFLGGIPLQYLAASDSIGRRVQTWEFPQRDQPRSRDLGRRAVRYRIDCLIVGNRQVDWLERRRQLADLLQSPGPYELIHPWGGDSVQVNLDGAVRFEQSVESAGKIRLSIPLVEAGEIVPLIEDDLRVSLEDAAARLDVEAAANLDNSLNLSSLDTAAIAKISEGIRDFADRIGDINRQVSERVSFANDITSALNEVTSNTQALLLAPQQMHAALGNLARGVLSAPTALAAAVRQGTSFLQVPTRGQRKVNNPSNIATDATRSIGTQNLLPASGGSNLTAREATAALDVSNKAAALVWFASFVPSIEFVSREEVGNAINVVDELVDGIIQPDLAALQVESRSVLPTTLNALFDLQAAMVQFLRDVSGQLPNVSEVTHPVAIPSLLFAHYYSGSARLEPQLQERNFIENSFFVTGPVEVLGAV